MNVLKEFSSVSDFDKYEYTEMHSFHWENSTPYRPRTFFKMGIVNGDIEVNLKCYEKSPRAVYFNRDEPIYKDSCLEFFVAPIENRAEYINIESNSNGAFLCEFGSDKNNRRFVKEFSKSSPKVESFSGEDGNGVYWGVSLTLTKLFIAEVYDVNDKELSFNKIKANFYKCGDDCEKPHYIAFSPVTTLPPGFHNPECFAEFSRK